MVEIAQSGKKISSIYDEYDVDNDPFLQDMIYFNFEEFNGIEKKYFDECVWSVAESILKDEQANYSKMFGQAADLNERKSISIKMQDTLKKIKDKNLEDFYG